MRYKRSPFCMLTWDGASLVARNCHTGRRFRGAERYVWLLHHLPDWASAADVAARLERSDVAAVERGLAQLVGMGLVVAEPPAGASCEGSGEAAAGWNLVDLAFQRQSGLGGYDPSRARPGSPPSALKPPGPAPVKLASRSLAGTGDLGAVLDQRRSIRTYADKPLPIDDLGTFLHAAARVTRYVHDPVLGEMTLRPSPSGGARHPLELYPLCNSVGGLAPGAYHYHPGRHELSLVRPADERQAELNRQVGAATADAVNRDPPVVLLVTAVFQRTMWKYDEIGLSLILKDVGALYQTMYLVATAMGLAPCAIGGGRESDNARWLGLDPLVESQVGCFLLGVPRRT